MRNIMKSQVYQLSRDLFTICVLLVSGVVYWGIVFRSLGGADELNGGTVFVSVGEWFAIISSYLLALITTRICGWDFNDKTINYEILSGHGKSESYFARLALVFALVLAVGVLMLGLPVVIGTICGGWGPNLSAGAALVRSLCALLLLLRFTAEAACVTFFLRNAYSAMIICMIAPEIGVLLPLLTGQERLGFLSSMYSLMELLSFENARTGFVDGKDITIYLTDMDRFSAVAIPAAAVVLLAGSVFAGYRHLMKNDL